MAKTTNVSIRMYTELKKQADALFNALGMNLSTAFNIFGRVGFPSRSSWRIRTRKRLLP